MEMGIRVEAEHLQSVTSRHANNSDFTMAAVDTEGKPVVLPPLRTDTDVAKRRSEDAKRRCTAQREAFAGEAWAQTDPTSGRPGCHVENAAGREAAQP